MGTGEKGSCLYPSDSPLVRSPFQIHLLYSRLCLGLINALDPQSAAFLGNLFLSMETMKTESPES